MLLKNKNILITVKGIEELVKCIDSGAFVYALIKSKRIISNSKKIKILKYIMEM